MSILLQERLTFKKAQIETELTESTENGGKTLYMKGIFVQGGIKNQNERIYPVSEIRKAVESINESISRGIPVLGELDHPEELNINLDRVTHDIRSMWMDGPNGMGKLRILETPKGMIAKTLLLSGIPLGVSSRGYGNVNQYNNEVSDFVMKTVDIVADPSCIVARPTAVLESLNSNRGNVIDDLTKAVLNDPSAQKYLQKELLEWFKKI